MSKTRLNIAKKDILSLFNSLDQKIFKRADIEEILREKREFWRLAQSTNFTSFIRFLKEYGKIQEHRFAFPTRKEIRYTWGEIGDYEIIQTLRPNSYFTHFTALYFHGLTQQVPKTVYLNYELPKGKSTSTELEQSRIDFAFKQSCRISRNIAEFKDKRVCILNGKYTGNAGVTEIQSDSNILLRVSNLERTLIDIVVRPVYSGGIPSVINAYREAADRVSINKLTALLSSISYIYPFHQAIGFYLEKSGAYTEKQISIIDRFEKKYDFYLTHKIAEKEYSKHWKIYYPKGL